MEINKKKYYSSGFLKIFAGVLLSIILATGILAFIFYFKKTKTTQPTSKPEYLQEKTNINFLIDKKLYSSKNLITKDDIVVEKINITPKIPKYNLPLKTKDIANFSEFSKKIKLSPKALSLLQKNGFVVISTPKDITEEAKDDFASYYIAIKNENLPIFVTTDSLLHYLHIFFDTTLMKLERDIFYEDLWQISKEFLNESILQYQNSTGDLKEAAKRNVAYFSVALELLKPKKDQIATKENIKREVNCYGSEDYCNEIINNLLKEGKLYNLFSESEAKNYTFQIPNFVRDLVQKEIELINKHHGWEKSPIFVYEEDYSQYIPRGHYTKSEKMKNYFKAMMWYGRMTFLIKGSAQIKKGESFCTEDGIISEYDAKIQTLQAFLIANNFLKSKEIQQKWNRIYAISSFFVGYSDDLGPYEYISVLNTLFNGKANISIEDKYPTLKNVLLSIPYNPKIYSGLGKCELPTIPSSFDKNFQELTTKAKKILEATKGFRLMGQRFTIDSWILSNIVSPYTGEYTGNKEKLPFTCVETETGRLVRGFPRGLDIMALLGSNRAKEILVNLGDTQYSFYETKFNELKKELNSIPEENWYQNIYSAWLYVLKSLLTEFKEGYQTFMQTKAWQDKELNTALASWAELRHDTILYVKQSYTAAERGGGDEELPIVGYVEPIPEFYSRLLVLIKLMNKGLKKLVSQEELEKLKIEEALNEFSEVLTRLLEISKKELENKILTNDDYRFIENFGEISKQIVNIVAEGETDPDIFKTTLIADVHTDGNTEKVLEEGVGYINTLVVAYKLPQGHILLGIGPVFSYYEFKQPMKNRLTDEEWRKLLDIKSIETPEWTKTFSE